MLKEILTFGAKILDFLMKMTSKERRARREKNAIQKKAKKQKDKIDQAVSKEKTGDINNITADVFNRHDDSDDQLPDA
jgi:hypothetical protein